MSLGELAKSVERWGSCGWFSGGGNVVGKAEAHDVYGLRIPISFLEGSALCSRGEKAAEMEESGVSAVDGRRQSYVS